ncbi:MAG: YjgN family protein [Granulosicoccus sp.]
MSPATEDETSLTTEATAYPFEFRGNGFEYFKIWIVNILLTILTLYVYSAWAKVRTNRYFYGNTYLDNSSFEYHVKPLQILLSRLIAVVLMGLIVFGQNFSPIVSLGAWGIIIVLFPWALWRSLKFNSYMSSYRNIRFGFDGKLAELYFITIGVPIMSIVVLGIATFCISFVGNKVLTTIAAIASVIGFYALYPWMKKLITTYMLNNYRYGRTSFSATLSTGSYFTIYAKAVLLFIASLLVVGVIGAVAYSATGNGIADVLRSMKGDASGGNEEAIEALIGKLTFVFIPLTYIWFFLLYAYITARVRNYSLSQTTVGADIRLKSDVGARALTWLTVSNLLLIVFTTGLAFPWAKVRAARFYANHTTLISTASLDQYVASEKQEVGAFGEELGDAFNLDIGI